MVECTNSEVAIDRPIWASSPTDGPAEPTPCSLASAAKSALAWATAVRPDTRLPLGADRQADDWAVPIPGNRESAPNQVPVSRRSVNLRDIATLTTCRC